MSDMDELEPITILLGGSGNRLIYQPTDILTDYITLYDYAVLSIMGEVVKTKDATPRRLSQSPRLIPHGATIVVTLG